MPDSALRIKGLSYAYGDLPVLENVGLRVEPGEFVAVVGPSGSGKSTLFHLVGGLLTPGSGSITIAGEPVRRGLIGYMPQAPALLPWRTIEDNAIVARELRGTPRREARELARAQLAKAGLDGFAKSYPHQLSGGMQQRVAFLRALLADQPLICLDEPFSALDAMLRADMHQWLLEVWEQNRRAILFVTHNIEEALLLADTVYVFTSRPATVLERIDVPFPRPRRAEVVDDPEFVRLRRRITDSLKAKP